MGKSNKWIAASIVITYIVGWITNLSWMMDGPPTIYGFISTLLFLSSWIVAAIYFRSKAAVRISFAYWFLSFITSLLYMVEANGILDFWDTILFPSIFLFYTPLSGIGFIKTVDYTFFVHSIFIIMCIIFFIKIWISEKMGRDL